LYALERSGLYELLEVIESQLRLMKQWRAGVLVGFFFDHGVGGAIGFLYCNQCALYPRVYEKSECDFRGKNQRAGARN